MSWSTSQLADLAGTTVKTVRHYHQIGLLEEPERASNGYKKYGVSHLVRLLRIKRLGDLGVPLSQVALMQGNDRPEEALRIIDAELTETIERLQRVRVEVGTILSHRAPTDLPSGFSEVGLHLSEPDRALILIYAQIFGPGTMQGLLDMMKDPRKAAEGEPFDALPADADEDRRQKVADQHAPLVRYLTEKYPWMSDPGAGSDRGPAYVADVITHALMDLYNPAQIDVLQRVHRILHPADTDAPDRS